MPARRIREAVDDLEHEVGRSIRDKLGKMAEADRPDRMRAS
jgi:hypothetical protein